MTRTIIEIVREAHDVFLAGMREGHRLEAMNLRMRQSRICREIASCMPDCMAVPTKDLCDKAEPCAGYRKLYELIQDRALLMVSLMQPDDDSTHEAIQADEQTCKDAIIRLQRLTQDLMQPWLTRLANLEALKPPAPVIMPISKAPKDPRT